MKPGLHPQEQARLAALREYKILETAPAGKIWALREETSGTWTRFELLSTSRRISSFGRDALGEIYVVDYSGEILRIARPPQ